MTQQQLKQKLRSLLKSTYFDDPEDWVYVSDGDEEDVHVVVVSTKFRGTRLREKQGLIWSVLTQNLPPAEWGRVTLSKGLSPEDVEAAPV